MKNKINEPMKKINGEIRERYIQTKYGILPKGWRIENLKELSVDGINNGIFNDPLKVGKGIKLINVVDLYQQPFIKTKNLSRLDVLENEFKKYKVEKYDIFFTRSSLKIEGIAHCNININDTEDLVYDGHIMRIRPDREKMDPFFLRDFCLLPMSRKYFMRIAKTTTMTTIGQSDIAHLPVFVPPISEQHKISTILSTWDKAIALKEKIIHQKKRQKKGMIHSLLTGSIRVPGFHGEWKKTRLGEVLKERNEINHDKLELLSITAKSGVVKRTEVDIKDNSNENKGKYKHICPLDIGYNTMRMWQGVSGVSEYEGIVSPAYTVLQPTDRVDSYFIGYLFKLPGVVNLFWRHSQGLVDDTLNLKYANLKDIMVNMPVDIREQKAIASLLRVLDKEIVIHNEELELLKQQKKGLMQLLLTGKVRVQF